MHEVSSRKVISDSRGDILHILKSTDSEFAGFGEVYISWINPGAVKAWKLHTKAITNLVVPIGEVSFIIKESDEPEGEHTQIYLSPNNYRLLSIPSNVWYGFKGISSSPSMIISCSSLPHDPNEALRREHNETVFNVNWDRI